MDSVGRPFQKLYQRWLNKRLPPTQKYQTQHKGIFIVPNGYGITFLFGAALVIVLGINYQNTLTLGIGLFMICFLVAAIMLTYRAINGLELEALHAPSVYRGDFIHFPFLIKPAYREWVAQIGWITEPEGEWITIQNEREHQLSLRAEQRGRLNPPRIKVSSRYPLGLCTAWTLPRLKFEALVYPKPNFLPFQLDQQVGSEADYEEGVTQSDDIKDFRPYQIGDSLKHVMWRQRAKGRPLVVKEFDHYASEKLIFDYDHIGGMGTEEKLSVLCGWILQAERMGMEYGLTLPGQRFSPARDQAHREKCLRALALFGLEKNENEEPISESQGGSR